MYDKNSSQVSLPHFIITSVFQRNSLIASLLIHPNKQISTTDIYQEEMIDMQSILLFSVSLTVV
jgi:hypothetical protein